MPIKGLSDIRRLPRVGKIRLGERTVSQKGAQYPRAVDYFVVREDDATSAEAVRAFRSVYGDKPRRLRIMFPSDDLEVIFPQYLKAYRAGVGLWCKGDGEEAQRVGENGQLIEVSCPCELLQKGQCKQVAHLQFILPDVPIIGVWQIDTSSYHSITQINNAIHLIKTMTGGRIQGIPMTLYLKPKEVSPDGRKKTVYVMDLLLEGMTLPELVRVAQHPTPALMAPDINHEEIPEDLYPQDLVNSVKASLPEPGPHDEGSDDFEEGFIDDETEPAPDEGLMAELEEAARQLGWTPSRLEANIQAARAKGIGEKELLRRMRAKIEQVQGAQAQAAPAPQQDASKPAQAAPLAANGHRRRVF